MKLTLTLLLLVAVTTVGSMEALAGKKAKATKDTLFNRLGGKKGITAVVDDFVTNCATDDRIKSFFASTAANPKQLATFKNHLVNQICEASGGPCKYKGKSMKAAHANMGVKSEHFDALVEDLVKALDKFNVAEADKTTLLGVLGPMKADIVETKSASAPATEAETAEN